MRSRRALAAGLAAVAALLAVAASSLAGEDSPWERGGVRAVASEVTRLEHEVELMRMSANRYAGWDACLRGIPVSEYGDPDGRTGYLYDERDGTGKGRMPALAVDRTSRPRREEYLFLHLSRKGNCGSEAPLPGGTAAPASTRRPTLASLERRVGRLKRATPRLEAASERFDEWESCVSWVPVTENGDPDGTFGYLFGTPGGPTRYRSAIAIDRSDWDDPDYMFLAFVGGDRPGRSCQDEPGEAID